MMTVKDLRKIAKERGVKTRNLRKVQLVKAIQRSEGSFDCFGTAVDGYCDQYGCLFREDCLSMKSRR